MSAVQEGVAMLKILTLLTLSTIFQVCVCSQPSAALDLRQLNLSVIVPRTYSNAPSAPWKRGLEILPGAQLAAESINAHNGTLPSGCHLEIHIIHSGDCETETFLFLPSLVNSSRHPEFAGAIKQMCSNAVQFISGPLKEHGIASILPLYSRDTLLIDAMLHMMGYMNWTQVGVITELSNTFFSYTAESFHRAARENDIMVRSFIQLHHEEEVDFRKLPNVILVSVSAPLAVKILCVANERGQLWPKRAWILHSYWLDDFLGSGEQSHCNISKAMEGILLVRDKLQPTDGSNYKIYSGESYADYLQKYKRKLSENSREYGVHLKANPYANALHDAVWIAVLTNNYGYGHCSPQPAKLNLSNGTFAGAQGIIKVDSDGSMLRAIDIVQIKESVEKKVGRYYIPNSIFINNSLLRDAPMTSVHIAGGSTAYTVGLAFEIAISSTLVTIFLLLYVYFRDEPEIKSTSLILSLFMFLGCYLTLVYLVLLLLSDQPSDTGNYSYYSNLCPLLQWTSGLGIPLPLITGTMLIKLFRIHYIFKKFNKTGPAPVGRKCSDAVLALLVLLTISPNVAILVIWSAVDDYRLVVVERGYRGGALLVDKQCTSDHLVLWIGGWIICLVFLLLALLLVAIKTRNIRLRHYKDTKKVNAFIFVLNLNIVLTVSYWILLRQVSQRHITGIVSHIGHSALVISCQVFLFAPKVFPPMLRCLSTKLRSSTK